MSSVTSDFLRVYYVDANEEPVVHPAETGYYIFDPTLQKYFYAYYHISCTSLSEAKEQCESLVKTKSFAVAVDPQAGHGAKPLLRGLSLYSSEDKAFYGPVYEAARAVNTRDLLALTLRGDEDRMSRPIRQAAAIAALAEVGEAAAALSAVVDAADATIDAVKLAYTKLKLKIEDVLGFELDFHYIPRSLVKALNAQAWCSYSSFNQFLTIAGSIDFYSGSNRKMVKVFLDTLMCTPPPFSEMKRFPADIYVYLSHPLLEPAISLLLSHLSQSRLSPIPISEKEEYYSNLSVLAQRAKPNLDKESKDTCVFDCETFEAVFKLTWIHG